MTALLTRRATLALAVFVAAGSRIRAAGPTRIVIAGGDLTEIAVALGDADRIVGVDSTSVYPPEMTTRAQIGYVRQLAPEGVLALDPDLLIAASDVGPAAALDKLRAAGLRVEVAPAGTDAGSVAAKIAFLGGVLGREAEATALVATYRAEMDRLAAAIAGVSTRPRVLFVLSIQNGAPLVGGAGTAADAMIALAGGVNAAKGFAGYKPMNREAVIAAAPEVLLMMDGHAERQGGVDAVLARPEVALTPAGQASRAIVMDGLLLLGFGPRTPEAVRQLATLLHPDDAERLDL